MMITGHSHLGHEQHHDTFRLGDHSIYIDQVCSTNYIEPASLLTTNNLTPTVNLSTGQEATPSAMSICLQPHGTFGTPITVAQSSQHDRTNHDLWPSRLTPSVCGGVGQWSNGHKFYIPQEQQNICEKQTQASNGTFYDYLQTKFTPIANYNDQSRPPETVKLDSHQHQQYLITVNDYSQHYYNSNANNQANPTTINYNIDEYGNQIAHRNYQTDMANHVRYTQPTYSDNNHQHHTSMFNQTEPTNLNEPSLLYQQNYTPLLKQTSADRFTQADQSHSWSSHQDYSRAIISHHQHHQPQPGVVGADFAQQTNSWLDKPETRAQYQTHEATYDYYRSPLSPPPPPPPPDHCTPNQPYHANQTDPNRVQIIESSPSLAATNYESAEPIANIGLQSGENVNAATSVLKPQPKLPSRQTPSSVQSRKSSVVQTAKKRHECKDKIKDTDQAATSATNTSNNQHTNQSDRLNQCRICGRHYARPSTLKTHLRTHTNERPYKCAVCCKTFSQAANLTAHQRVHTGERPFPCPICGRQFSQSSSVITHLRTHSGERPYRCNMCQRTFSDSSTLTKHCRIHSGEKPYQCEYCPMNFSQSGNLSRHLRLHSIGDLNKTQPTTETVATTPSVPPSNTGAVGVESSTRSSTNQRNYSSNPSFSPESTLSSCSVSSLIVSGAGNSTPSSSASS